MKKIIALIVMFAVAFSLIGCFPQTTVKADIEHVEIEAHGFDTGLSEIVITNDIIDEYSSISVSAKAIWKGIKGDYTVTWAFVGDNLGCEVYIIDPCCTGGTLVNVDLGDKIGKVTLRATASSKNQISADLTIWIGQENKQPKIGGLYDLQEAYENEWLTQEELGYIAFLYNNRYNAIEPQPERSPLNNETESKIKQTYLESFFPEFLIDFSGYDYLDIENPIDGVRITAYYGTYNNCVIVSIWDDFVCYDWPQTFDVTIGGVVFEDFWIREIFVWVEQEQLITGELWEHISWYGQSSGSIEQGYNILQLAEPQQEYSYNWYVGYYDDWAYIYKDGGISRIRPDGSDIQPLNISYFTQAMIHDGWLYYTEGGFNMYTGMPVDAIKRVRLDGTENMTYENTAELVTIRTGGLEGAPDPMTVRAGVCNFEGYGDWIYYTAGASIWDVTLYRINIDGMRKTKIAENCTNFIIANGYLIVSSEIGYSQFHTKITRYDLNGNNAKVLIEDTTTSFSPIIAHGDYLYYSAYVNSPSICRMKLDGTDAKTIALNASFRTLMNGKIYYTDSVLRGDSGWERKQRLFSIDIDGASEAVMLYDDIYIDCIIGDSVFFETSESVIGYNKVFRRLKRLSLIDGSITEVYNNGGTENYRSFFIHENEVYVVLT